MLHECECVRGNVCSGVFMSPAVSLTGLEGRLSVASVAVAFIHWLTKISSNKFWLNAGRTCLYKSAVSMATIYNMSINWLHTYIVLPKQLTRLLDLSIVLQFVKPLF